MAVTWNTQVATVTWTAVDDPSVTWVVQVDATVTGGVVGLIIDGRGRPLPHSKDTAERVAALRQAYDSFGLPAERCPGVLSQTEI